MIVEKSFGMNDWVVISGVFIIWLIFFILPKSFPRQHTILVMLYGLTVASVIDNSFGTNPFDYYDIMDGPEYTLMDGVVYLLYPPYAYFFFYIYRLFHFKVKGNIFYIILWSFISVFVEGVFTKFGVFHYKGGFSIYFSFSIYLIVQTGLLILIKQFTTSRRSTPDKQRIL